ncbi:(2Fe-2S)-binding protein [Methylobacterium sp. J-043]|uniref:(2Fe-2S)-binding protein n=1 Tax=Methylorubrum TaxID=2282523 RepID=UPI0020A14540|nr:MULTISPECIES: (2Fe-2S)-binding protein [Methylorubrum]MCJ2031709.1 (2Fe-2S)-binding protein [Methylobacterium sp. J-043]
MIVCSCNVLSDGQVRACLQPGPGCPRTPAQVYGCLGCSPKCGRCARTIRSILRNAIDEAQAHSAAHGGAHACSTACEASCSLGSFQTTREPEGVAA